MLLEINKLILIFDIYGLIHKAIMILNYEIINYNIFIICELNTKY